MTPAEFLIIVLASFGAVGAWKPNDQKQQCVAVAIFAFGLAIAITVGAHL